jgi:hypothetical protein
MIVRAAALGRAASRVVAQLAAINREAEAFRRPFPKRCASRGDLDSPGVEILGRAGPFELTAYAPVVQKLARRMP